MIRLDKFFTSTGTLSRKECQIAIKRKQITVGGIIVRDSSIKIDENNDVVLFNGDKISYNKYCYIMLNKPIGVVSATEDKLTPTVLDLLSDKHKKLNLFPCGRLDKDTTGLVILTNDGVASHRLLSPKHHVSKKYYFECAEVLLDSDLTAMESGVDLKDGYTTKPCAMHKITDFSGYITLVEGKYHQIKRMFGAYHNKITKLERVSFSTIELDKNLAYGEWRYLTDDEIKVFTEN